MKTLKFTEAPLKVFGVPFFEETKTIKRLPDSIMEKLTNLSSKGFCVIVRRENKSF